MRVLLLSAVLALCGCRESNGDRGFSFADDFVCVDRPDDSTGYLQLICEYIASELDGYPIDPNELDILSTEAGDVQQEFPASPYADADHDFVQLSCCYTGDWAVIDTRTTEVVELYLGDL